MIRAPSTARSSAFVSASASSSTRMSSYGTSSVACRIARRQRSVSAAPEWTGTTIDATGSAKRGNAIGVNAGCAVGAGSLRPTVIRPSRRSVALSRCARAELVPPIAP